jgi:hypothetical protein
VGEDRVRILSDKPKSYLGGSNGDNFTGKTKKSRPQVGIEMSLIRIGRGGERTLMALRKKRPEGFGRRSNYSEKPSGRRSKSRDKLF